MVGHTDPLDANPGIRRGWDCTGLSGPVLDSRPGQRFLVGPLFGTLPDPDRPGTGTGVEPGLAAGVFDQCRIPVELVQCGCHQLADLVFVPVFMHGWIDPGIEVEHTPAKRIEYLVSIEHLISAGMDGDHPQGSTRLDARCVDNRWAAAVYRIGSQSPGARIHLADRRKPDPFRYRIVLDPLQSVLAFRLDPHAGLMSLRNNPLHNTGG